MSSTSTSVINRLRAVSTHGFKFTSRPSKTYFCEIEQKRIEVPKTIEINLNCMDPGVEVIRTLASIANSEGYVVDFYNGQPFIKQYKDSLRKEGYSV